MPKAPFLTLTETVSPFSKSSYACSLTFTISEFSEAPYGLSSEETRKRKLPALRLVYVPTICVLTVTGSLLSKAVSAKKVQPLTAKKNAAAIISL